MIETITIPILMKAIDFLFDEGRKIFQERRERRKLEHELQESNQEVPAAPDVNSIGKTGVIQSKEEALTAPIDEATWKHLEGKVKHLMSLLDIYTKNYYLAREQYAKWGDALVPPIITHNLAEAEDQVAKTSKELQTVLSEVYATPVTLLKAGNT